MPIADIMDVTFMTFENLPLLGFSVGTIRHTCAMVGSPWAGGFGYNHITSFERREQLATSFSVPRRDLSMLLKVLNDRGFEDETLSRSAELKYDHSVNSYPTAF